MNQSAELKAAAAEEIGQAASRHGFFYLQNTPVSTELIREVHISSRTLFGRSQVEKSAISTITGQRGFYRYESQGGKTDYIEAFSVGREVPNPFLLKQTYYEQIGLFTKTHLRHSRVIIPKAPDHAPNKWPEGDAAFREVMLRYFDAAAVTAELVLSAFATYLSLPSSFFDPFHDKKDHQLEVKMYPAIAQSALGERSLGFRLPVHTDLSSLTLLIQDRMGGLIVQERETQEWLPVQVIDNAILVNTGQFISDWTGAVLPSTKVG